MDPPLHAMTPRLRRALAEAAHHASRAGHEAVRARLREVLPTLVSDAAGDDAVEGTGPSQNPTTGRP